MANDRLLDIQSTLVSLSVVSEMTALKWIMIEEVFLLFFLRFVVLRAPSVKRRYNDSILNMVAGKW